VRLAAQRGRNRRCTFARRFTVTDMYGSTTRKFALGLLIVAELLTGRSALADLMLHPNRVVLEGKQRTAQLEVINRGDTTNVYRLRLVRKRMTELGEFVTIDDPLPGELFADDLVRYSPRQIELAPGASQTIRLMLRKPAELAPGEYRSHLLFERLPDVADASARVQTEDTGKDVDIKLTALVSISIPLIVRHGETSATVTLNDLQVESSAAGEPVLSFALQRSGERSVYGDLVVAFTPTKGPQQVVARAGGVAVYAPNALRRGRLVLKSATRTPLAAGKLHVTYRERRESGGQLLAEAVLQVP
jgi:P pilus assembly chaperone PapD